MKRLFPALFLAATGLARADIYVCEVDGHKTFSQQPCGQSAKSMTLSNDVRRLTLPDPLDEQAANDLCQLLKGAWDMAASSNRNQNASENQVGTYDSVESRLQGYVRERISNYQELVNGNRTFLKTLESAIEILVDQSYSSPNMTPEAITRFKDRCVSNVMYNSDIEPAPKPRRPVKR